MRAVIDARLRRRGAGIEGYVRELLPAFGRLAPGEITPIVNPGHVALARRAGLRPWVLRPGRRALPDADVILGPAFVPPEHPRAQRAATIHDLGYMSRPDLHPAGFGAELDARVRAAVPHTARWLCDSAFTRDEFVAHYRVAPERCRTVWLGVSGRFSPGRPRRPRRDPYLLHVGSLVPRKDVLTLLEAFSRLAAAHPRLRVLLAGNRMRSWATQAPEIKVWRREHPELAGRVDVLGYVAARRLPDLYRGAAAYVSTSLFEGFGLPALEALACGAPVVSSSGSAVEEYAGEVVALAPPGDAEAFAAAIERVLAEGADPAAGLALAASLTWDRTARETLAVLREAVEDPV